MRVYLCAGDKTERVTKYLLNNRKSSMDIEGQPSILECLDILAARGMIYDKLVIIGYTFDQFTTEDADRVFDNLRALASSFNETQEIVIFGTHENPDLDLEKLYFRHLSPFKCVRWEGSGKIKMADIESIIIGSRSIEVGSPVTQGMKETKIQKTAPLKDNPSLKRSGAEPPAKRGLFGRKKAKKQDIRPEAPKGPIRGGADDLKKLEEVSLDPTVVSPVGTPVAPQAAGRVMSLKEKRELAQKMTQQTEVAPPLSGGVPGGVLNAGVPSAPENLYDDVRLGQRSSGMPQSGAPESIGGFGSDAQHQGVPAAPSIRQTQPSVGGFNDSVQYQQPLSNRDGYSENSESSGGIATPVENGVHQQPEGNKVYGGPERIQDPEIDFRVNLMDPNMEKPPQDLSGPSGCAPLEPDNSQMRYESSRNLGEGPIGHGPHDFDPRKVQQDAAYPDGARGSGGFGNGVPEDQEAQYGPLRGQPTSSGVPGSDAENPSIGANVSFIDSGVTPDQVAEGISGPVGGPGPRIGVSTEDPRSFVQQGAASHPEANSQLQASQMQGGAGLNSTGSNPPGVSGRAGGLGKNSAAVGGQAVGAPNTQQSTGGPIPNVSNPVNSGNSGNAQQSPQAQQGAAPQPKKGFLSAITGGLGRKKKQSVDQTAGQIANQTNVVGQGPTPVAGGPQPGIPLTGSGQQVAPAFQGQQVGAAVESYGKSKGKTKLIGKFPDLAKCDEMRRRTHAFFITGDRRCGKSGTASNLGMIGAAAGLHTLVIDMDLRGRGISLYFPQEMNTEDNLYTASLSNALRSPHMMRDYVWKINPLLDVLGLDLSIDDISVHEKMITAEKIEMLLGEAKTEYELVVVDFPFDMLVKYAKTMTQCDRLAFVTENDVCSMVNIINLIAPSTFSSTVDYHMFRSKLGFIINRYNANHTMNESLIAPNYFTLMLNNLVEDGQWGKYPVYGTVEEINTYSKQLDNGSLLCNSKGFDEIFFEMLYCMYK